ncbi:hypothetical protein PQ369_000583 [Campylobacter coli]|nr:hypothetical protein [Campylobacter coli]
MSNAPVIINNVEVNLNIKENKVFINSLDLAKVFNKNHRHILQTTKNQPQNDFTESNFILSTYKKGIKRFNKRLQKSFKA